jgi:hypothetical protein
MLNSIFQNNKTVAVKIQNRTQAYVNGQLGPVTYTDLKTVKGIFYRGAVADNMVSERLRANIEGVVLVRPGDSPIETDRLEIDGNFYSVVYADNIAGQDKVIVIPVKKYVS